MFTPGELKADVIKMADAMSIRYRRASKSGFTFQDLVRQVMESPEFVAEAEKYKAMLSGDADLKLKAMQAIKGGDFSGALFLGLSAQSDGLSAGFCWGLFEISVEEAANDVVTRRGSISKKRVSKERTVYQTEDALNQHDRTRLDAQLKHVFPAHTAIWSKPGPSENFDGSFARPEIPQKIASDVATASFDPQLTI